MKVQYVYYAVIDFGQSKGRSKEAIVCLDEELPLDEVEETIERFRPYLNYDYIVVEKQLHQS